MERVLSGIQPTGEMHLGNYFGAIKNWVDLQDRYECVYGVVDLHAMTMPYKPEDLRENTVRMVADLIACGVNPDKAILFVQSLVPEHAELNWIFNCVASYGELTRMTQFKDKSDQLEAQTKDYVISAGLFTYPVLQAADILVYRAQHVPVGKDQEQHLELTRNIAQRFNFMFGEYFPEPKPLYTNVPKLLSLADPTKKMSKSLGDKHIISLFEEETSIRKKVASAVTDSGQVTDGSMSPGVENLITLIRAAGNDELAQSFINDYNAGTLRYKPLKDAVADTLVAMLEPFKARRTELLADREYLNKIIHSSSDKARAIASETMKEVKRLTGLQ